MAREIYFDLLGAPVDLLKHTQNRRVLRIKWFHRVRNEDVLKEAQITSMETMISAMRLRWFGHVVRMPDDRLPRFSIVWKPNYGK